MVRGCELLWYGSRVRVAMVWFEGASCYGMVQGVQSLQHTIIQGFESLHRDSRKMYCTSTPPPQSVERKKKHPRTYAETQPSYIYSPPQPTALTPLPYLQTIHPSISPPPPALIEKKTPPKKPTKKTKQKRSTTRQPAHTHKTRNPNPPLSLF